MVTDAQRLTDIEKQSVQGRAEASEAFGSGDMISPDMGLLWVTLGGLGEVIPPYDYRYPNRRDLFLQEIARQESMMAAAKYALKTRAQTLDYKLNGPDTAKHYAEQLLYEPYVGDSYESLVAKTIDDFTGSNNGVFWEKIAPGNPLTPIGDRPVLGIGHLDSRLCWRTYDPNFPVIYTNPQTRERHLMHRDRVVLFADNPQPNELARGIGFCAVDRALAWTRIIRDSTIYREEKISGKFNRAIGVAQGISNRQLRQALVDRDAEDEGSNLVIYNSIPFVTAPVNATGTASQIKMDVLDLASIPDGFVFKDDVTLYAYILAFCFGVDAREFWPMTQSGATKADASIQHMKSQGKAFGLLLRMLQWSFRQCLPRTVTLEYDFTDDEQDARVAELNGRKAQTYALALDKGALNPLEMRALMIADGALDGTVLENLELPVNVMDTDQDDDEQDALTENTDDEPDEADEATKKKAAEGLKFIADDYRRRVNHLVRTLWNGDITAFDFVDNMNSTITLFFRRAWYEGAAQYGIQPEELSDAERNRLETEINQQISYLLPFMRAIQENSQARAGALLPLLQRAEMWVNELERIRMLAQNMAGADRKAEWVVGPTEHCETCLFYEGKVYRRSIWEKYLRPLDLLPRGRSLDCHGYRCQCNLMDTDKPVTPGRPPIWKVAA